MQAFNYRHLYYFWVAAREGGMARAADRLGVAVQTVSTQIRELEQHLGTALFKPAGRTLALTDAGQIAAAQADQIFQLGEALPDLLRDAASPPALRLAVGITDELPKLVVHRLMHEVLAEPRLRLLCRQGSVDDLLADLALHRLDLVLTDRAVAPNPNLRIYSHPLGASDIAWYASAAHAAQAQRDFPRSLANVPVLLPAPQAAVRMPLDLWFEREAVQPRIVGEFADSALLKTFGANGMGVFPAAEIVHDELVARYQVRQIGRCRGVSERFYAITAEKRVAHPLVLKMLVA